MKPNVLILTLLFFSSCSTQQFLALSHYSILVGSIMAAFGVYGTYHFSKKVDPENSKINNKPIDIDTEKYKEWSLEKDAPIILETIDLQVNMAIRIFLNKGETIQTNILKWKVGNTFPVPRFIEKWERGEIPLDNIKGGLKLSDNKLEIKNQQGKIEQREFELKVGKYQIFKKYYLTNSNSLPSSKEIVDFNTKKVNRTFKEEDLVKFNLKNVKIYDSLQEIPGQTKNLIHFRLKPKIRINQ